MFLFGAGYVDNGQGMREAEVGFEHLTWAAGWGKVERGGDSWGWGWGWRAGKIFESVSA